MLVGPSGAGKTSLQAALGLPRLVTCTTREPRVGEQDGRDYHFLSASDFATQVRAGLFLETVTYHGHRYGTRREDVIAALARDDHVSVVEAQGATWLHEVLPSYVRRVGVWAEPLSIAKRLRARGDDPAHIAQRLTTLATETAYARACEYHVQVGDDALDAAVAQVRAWVRAARD